MLCCSQEEPRAIKKTLTLGYNLLNLGQVDNMKLGTITVSTIFRAVGSVTKSGSSASHTALEREGLEVDGTTRRTALAICEVSL